MFIYFRHFLRNNPFSADSSIAIDGPTTHVEISAMTPKQMTTAISRISHSPPPK